MSENIYNFSAVSGPPARKGDAASNSKGLVEGMKVGLRARDAKAGIPNSMTPAMGTPGSAAHQEPVSSGMKEDLKQGLRAWYAKKGIQINETTASSSVGAELPASALGQKQEWGGGLPSRRRVTPLPKGGSSLRSYIQSLERSLEDTLATLSNKKRFSEADEIEFRTMLIDALVDYINTGNSAGLKELRMQATLVESSKFIGEPAPETDQILTSANDPGRSFSTKMALHTGPIVEMVATQLSSGTPLNIVRGHVAAALKLTVDSQTRNTLSKAARVLAEM